MIKLNKNKTIVLLVSLCVFVAGCHIPRTLKPVEVRNDANKTILVDHIIWRYRIPVLFDGWYKFQQLKPYIGYKLEDYLKKAGWEVINYHDYSAVRVVKVSNEVLFDAAGPNVRNWLAASLLKNKIRVNDKMMANLLGADYMLSFFVYPNPDNFKEYKITAILLKFKGREEKLRFLERKESISFNKLQYSGIVEKVNYILYEKPLLITGQKAVEYTATAIFMALRSKGFV